MQGVVFIANVVYMGNAGRIYRLCVSRTAAGAEAHLVELVEETLRRLVTHYNWLGAVAVEGGYISSRKLFEFPLYDPGVFYTGVNLPYIQLDSGKGGVTICINCSASHISLLHSLMTLPVTALP